MQDAVDPKIQVFPAWLTSEVYSLSFSVSSLQLNFTKAFSIQIIFLVFCDGNVTRLKWKHSTPFLIVHGSLLDTTSETSECSGDTAAQVNADFASEASFRKTQLRNRLLYSS